MIAPVKVRRFFKSKTNKICVNLKFKKKNRNFAKLTQNFFHFQLSPPFRGGPQYDTYTPPGKFPRMSYEDGRMPRVAYRELPPHRMPHYEDDDIRKRRTSAREVIVQKADEWSDPWMRSKSPGARGSPTRRRDRRAGSRRDRSYSSDSSSSSYR